MDFTSALAKEIDVRRAKAGLSERALAEMSLTPWATAKRYFADPGLMRMRDLIRVARALGTTTATLTASAEQRERPVRTAA